MAWLMYWPLRLITIILRILQFSCRYGTAQEKGFQMNANASCIVQILSNTFASVNEDAAAEAMFRKAVSTIEG